MQRLTVAAFLSSLIAVTAYAAPTTGPSSAGANDTARLYRQAFARMKGLSADEGKMLGLCGKDGCWVVNTPLDVAAGDLVKRQAAAVELARKAASMPAAQWAIDGDVERMLELTNSGPRLSALLVLQARHDFRDGKTERALDDTVAAIALSRHLATDATLMSRMVEVAAWRPAADLLAQQLPALPKDLVAKLPARLEALPASPTMAETLRAEHAYAKRAAKGQGVAMVVMVSSLTGLYDAAAENAALAPEPFAKVIDEQAAKYPLNAWAKVIAPAMRNSRASIAVFEVKQAMLSTAIRIVDQGDRAVKESTDPFGDGAFVHRKTESGFELESALESKGERVTFVFGAR